MIWTESLWNISGMLYLLTSEGIGMNEPTQIVYMSLLCQQMSQTVVNVLEV